MRAAVHDTFGDVDVLQVTDVPEPEVEPGEVLVEVAATGVNHLDVLQRRGPAMLPGFTLPHIAGMDVAGTIVALGAGSQGLKEGASVLVNPAVQCGGCPVCLQGRDGLCADTRVIGASRPGGYAQRCVVPASHVHPIPDSLPAVEAATIPTVYSTAWHGLVVTGQVEAGETLLVHGAGSGVTAAAIQIAKHKGLEVIVSGRSEAKLEHALRLGADHVIDSTRSDVTAEAWALTRGAGVDIVFDHVGPALFQSSLLALRAEGRLVFCGTTTGGTAEFNLGHAYHKGVRLLGSRPYHQSEFTEMLDTVLGAGFAPITDTVMPLTEVRDAHRRIESGAVAGKLVLVP